MHDGDFIVCWFDTDPKETTDRSASSFLLLPVVTAETSPLAGGCAGSSEHPVDPRQ